jgi:hypothetical protein
MNHGFLHFCRWQPCYLEKQKIKRGGKVKYGSRISSHDLNGKRTHLDQALTSRHEDRSQGSYGHVLRQSSCATYCFKFSFSRANKAYRSGLSLCEGENSIEEIKTPFVRNHEQLADIFTKALDKLSQWNILGKLGSINLYEPNLRESVEK